jgi:hypothetical protein
MAEATVQLSTFKALIATADPPSLGPQRRPGTTDELDLGRKLDGFFNSHQVSARVQPLLRSAALLWHDHLDASHAISQSIETRDGSWLHGIMHRREPDYGNAKYWFRRVGQHDAFPKLAKRVAELLHHDGHELAERLIENGEWMPLAFVDECERAALRSNAALTAALREIQSAEFDSLFDHILAGTRASS